MIILLPIQKNGKSVATSSQNNFWRPDNSASSITADLIFGLDWFDVCKIFLYIFFVFQTDDSANPFSIPVAMLLYR